MCSSDHIIYIFIQDWLVVDCQSDPVLVLTCKQVLQWWHTRLCSSSQRWAAPHFSSAGSKDKWNRRAGTGGPGPDRRAPHLPVRGWTGGQEGWGYGNFIADTTFTSLTVEIMGLQSVPQRDTHHTVCLKKSTELQAFLTAALSFCWFVCIRSFNKYSILFATEKLTVVFIFVLNETEGKFCAV